MSGSRAEVAFLARALKAPRVAALASSLAEQARAEGWDYEHYLAQVLSVEVTPKETHGGAARVKAARFPQVKTLDDFDFSFQRSVKRQQVSHLAQLDFLREATNVIFLGPPGTGKTHLPNRPGRPGRPSWLPSGLRHGPSVGGKAGRGQAGREAR